MRQVSRAPGLVSVTIVGLLLAACGASGTPSQAPASGAASAPASEGEAPTGGTVRIGIGGSPDSLNPGNGLLTEAYTLYELVY
ncbi:MAG TPA: hypothetical protein VF071_02960, partial [Candidatus Limnocylindria bacterium]